MSEEKLLDKLRRQPGKCLVANENTNSQTRESLLALTVEQHNHELQNPFMRVVCKLNILHVKQIVMPRPSTTSHSPSAVIQPDPL